MYAYCAFIPKLGHEGPASPIIGRCKSLLRLGYYREALGPVQQTIHLLEKPLASSTPRPIALADGRGAILGTLFRNGVASPVHKLSDGETQAIVATDGRALLQQFWGRYIAFIETAAGPRILADPTGGIDCHFYEHQHFYCFFSDVDDFAGLGLCDLHINWRHVQRHIQSPVEEQADTGLLQVSKVHPGETILIGPDGLVRSFLWDPTEIALTPTVGSLDDAADLLRAAVVQTLQSWAEAYGQFIVQLSGGLDSSIVLACLRGHKCLRDLVCINYNSLTADSDERFYARQVADWMQARLCEIEERPSTVDLSDVVNFKFTAHPMMVLANLCRGHSTAQIASRFSVKAMFDGHGGDEVFGRLTFYGSAIDYLMLNGLDRSFISIALETARLTRQTIWQTIYTAVKGKITRRIAVGPSPVEKFINYKKHIFPQFIDEINEPDGNNQVSTRTNQLPPGKRFHIMRTKITNRLFYPCRPDQHIDSVHALISQPILESVYRIPVYFLSHGAMQRGLARYAFRDTLPPEVVFRQSKSGINNFTDEVFRHNFNFLRDFYLDGILCKEGLLSRQAVEQAFKSDSGQGGAARTTLLSCLGAEAWLRHCCARGRQRIVGPTEETEAMPAPTKE